MSNFSYTSFKLFAIQIRNHIAQILKVSLTEANSQSIPLSSRSHGPREQASAPAQQAAARWGPRRQPAPGMGSRRRVIYLLLAFLSPRFIES